MAFGGEVRIYVAHTTNLVQKANQIASCYPTAAAALGRTLTATVMMGSMLKGRETVTVRINGGGPIGLIVADADAFGHVRGYAANPRVHLQYDSGKLNVGMAVGNAGDLFVTKDLGLKDYFTGQVPLQTGEIGDDFTYYFTKSEQIPSAVGLGVLVSEENAVIAAGGFILQVLPGASETTIVALEKALSNIEPVSEMVSEGLTPEQIVEKIAGDGGVKILDTMDLAFECGCNKEKFEPGLISLGATELENMIQEDNGAETVCHYCKQRYQFTAEELENLKR